MGVNSATVLLPVDLDTLRILALALAGGEHHVDVVGTPRLRATSPTSGGLATSVAPHETDTYHVFMQGERVLLERSFLSRFRCPVVCLQKVVPAFCTKSFPTFPCAETVCYDPR